MTQQTPYIGSKISLISKLDIRYEGILYTVDSKESTIALSKVKSYGTEDRNAVHTVPPQEDVYDYIIFKANDIKDLIVCETPKPPAPAFTDPAILQQGAIVSKEKPSAPGLVGGSSIEIASATRTSTPRDNAHSPSQQQQTQQQPKSWKNNDNNKSNNSTYRQGGYQNRNNQNRQQGYDGGNNKQQPRTYESQNRNGSNNYRQGNGQQNRNYESQNRNNYNNQNNRGGPRNNQSHGNRPLGPNNKLKFDNDYDFEKAYEQFKETLEAIVGDVQNVKLDDSHDDDAGSVKSGDGNETFYDKNKSFFDTISCEALEKEEGMNTRPDWRKERLTNQETFGQQAIRYFGYRRGGYNNRGGGGYNNRGGYGNNRQQQGYDNNRQNGYDNNRRGGYGGYNRGYDNNRQQHGRDNNRQQGESKA